MNSETYFLSSLESALFSSVHTCTFRKHITFDTGKECALVCLDPGLIGQNFGIGSDLNMFVITNRHEGEGLFPIKEFPCFIFIARPLANDIESKGWITAKDVEIVAWGELYRTKLDAEQRAFT